MIAIPELLTRIEQRRLWASFHKDWLIQLRELLRPQVPAEVALFIQSEQALIPDADEPFEIFTQYSLLVQQARDDRVIAALEIVSPTNKGMFEAPGRVQYLKKREARLDAQVNFLEIDVLLQGESLAPPAVHQFQRTAWTARHHDVRRQYHSWGWSEKEPLPTIDWEIERGCTAILDLTSACQWGRLTGLPE